MSGLWLSGAVLSGTFGGWGLVLLLPSFPLEKAGRWGHVWKERAEVLPSECRVLLSVFVLAFLVIIRMLSIFAARETRDAAGLVFDPVVVATATVHSGAVAGGFEPGWVRSRSLLRAVASFCTELRRDSVVQ